MKNRENNINFCYRNRIRNGQTCKKYDQVPEIAAILDTIYLDLTVWQIWQISAIFFSGTLILVVFYYMLFATSNSTRQLKNTVFGVKPYFYRTSCRSLRATSRKMCWPKPFHTQKPNSHLVDRYGTS